MQNPVIQFPFVGHTPNGAIVYSGVMPRKDGQWDVISYCPDADGSKNRTVGFSAHRTYDDAVEAAKSTADNWYQKVVV